MQLCPQSQDSTPCLQALRAPAAFTSQQQRPRSGRRLQRCYAADEEKKLDFSGNKRAVRVGIWPWGWPNLQCAGSAAKRPGEAGTAGKLLLSAAAPRFPPAARSPYLVEPSLGRAYKDSSSWVLQLAFSMASCAWLFPRSAPGPAQGHRSVSRD